MTRTDIPDRSILTRIQFFHTEHGYAPSVRDICSQTSMSVAGIHSRLTNLRSEGLIDWVDGMTRTLHLTPKGAQELGA